MKKMKNLSKLFVMFILLVLSISLFSCSTLDAIGDQVGDTAETAEEVKAYADLVKALTRNDFTDEERYYVGRSTCAYVFSKYKLVENQKITEYINQIGVTIAMASNKATTFNGYRFNIIDDEHPNAYGTPGGMILISIGMLKLCDNEDELAAVLAHEVEHIVKDHPMKAVSSETKKAALMNIAKLEAKKRMAEETDIPPELLDGVVNSFGDALGDIINVLDNGYEKETEYEADAGAVTTLDIAGYNVNALISIIQKLPHSDKSPYAANHPTPEERVEAIKNQIAELNITPYNTLPGRTKRFKKVMSNL